MHWCFVCMYALVTDSCQLSCGCWKSNLSPLEEQSVLLISEPFLQPRFRFSEGKCSLVVECLLRMWIGNIQMCETLDSILTMQKQTIKHNSENGFLRDRIYYKNVNEWTWIPVNLHSCLLKYFPSGLVFNFVLIYRIFSYFIL